MHRVLYALIEPAPFRRRYVLPTLNEMKVKAIYGLLIFAGVMLFGVAFWPTLYHYDEIKLGDSILPMRTNRITGTTERLYPSGWSPVGGRSNSREPELEQLKIDELNQLVAKCEIAYDGNLECDVYNGSGKTIKELIVQIKVTSPGGNTASRNYRLTPRYVNEGAAPLRSTNFWVSADVESSSDEMSWEIIEASGYLK
jgi:hypothetical protein